MSTEGTESEKANPSKLLELCNKISNSSVFIKDYRIIYKIGVLYDLYSISADDTKNIVQESLNKEIHGNNLSTDNKSIQKLLETAFIFSTLNTLNIKQSDNSEELITQIDNLKNKAYRIAISVYFLWKYLKETNNNFSQSNNIIIYRLFTRLGILSNTREKNIENIDIFSMDFFGKLEVSQKEGRNRFCIEDELEYTSNKDYDLSLFNSFFTNKEELLFSDFQSEVIRELIGKNKKVSGSSLAISAPTSAGKTFILKNFIILKILESLLKKGIINIVFIVPSKSLINELRGDFILLFKKYFIKSDMCNIHTHISGEDFIKNYNKSSNLFIFTQERLNYFYNDIKHHKTGYNFKFNILIVDEAHKIGSGYRGTLLSYIVSKIKKDNSELQLILLAPLLSKLNKFKEEFDLRSLEEKFSNFGMVAKNQIFVEKSHQVNGRLYKVGFFCIIEQTKELLFEINKNYGNSQSQYLTYLAKLFTHKNSQSIIFRYKPQYVKEQAISLYESYSKGDIHPNIVNEDLINYITDILPVDFPLKDFLSLGIGYHHGVLPSYIKIGIEDLFKKNEIRFLCANSTILEGVNLPAKNIFIGHDATQKNIQNIDFKNLVGRAGRLNEHLCGNVFYVEYEGYVEKILNELNPTQDLENNIETILQDDDSGNSKFDKFLLYLSKNIYKEPIVYKTTLEQIAITNENRDFEYMTGYLVSRFLDEILDQRENISGPPVSLSEIIDSYSSKINPPSYLDKISKFIYTRGKEKTEKLNKLNQLIGGICKDIYLKTRGDLELFNIIKKNIFIDPRKQLDFYLSVESGDNIFIIENIQKYVDTFNLLHNSTEVSSTYTKYGEEAYNVKVTSKLELIDQILLDIQKYFIQKYTHIFDGKEKTHYSGEYYSGTMLKAINQWISSVSIKNILGTKKAKFSEKLKRINNDIQFTYLNAFSIYFELANLGYRRFLQTNSIDLQSIEAENINEEEYKENTIIAQFDTNFLYYLEIGSFYPNIVFLVSKGVSRETAIWLKENGYIDYFPFTGMSPESYFSIKKDSINSGLLSKNKRIIIEELSKFIYNE